MLSTRRPLIKLSARSHRFAQSHNENNASSFPSRTPLYSRESVLEGAINKYVEDTLHFIFYISAKSLLTFRLVIAG